MDRARLDGLTGLRFFAALHVVVYHFFPLAAAHAPRALVDLQQSGHAAVSLFFVLSGFVLAYNYSALAPEKRARFWWARFARVYPLYALVALADVPLQLNALVPPSRLAIATTADLAGLQAWIPQITFVGNTPGWSVSVELFFYAAFPFLVMALFNRGNRFWIELIAWWLIAIGFASLPAIADGALATFIKCAPITRLPELIIGIGLGKAFLRREKAGANADALAIIALIGIAIVFAAQSYIPRYALHSILLPPFALLIWSIASGGLLGRALGRPIPRALGDASYAVYLLQMPLFQAISGKYEWSVTALAGFVALLIVVSIAVHAIIERPAQRALNAWWASASAMRASQ